jgi:hypothetical protein
VASALFSDGLSYLTLSHCWGGDLPLQLTLDSLDTFQVSIGYENLPATLRDAVDVVRSLNAQYLWIDALCIIQDSEDDRVQESSKMGQIYMNSRLNIAATASSNSHGGL